MPAVPIAQLMDHLAQVPELEQLLLSARAAGRQPTATEMAEVTGLDVDHVVDLTEQLIELGLVESEQSQANEVVPTARGRSLAAQLERSYSDGARRTEAIRRGVLESFRTQRRPVSTGLVEQWPGRSLQPAPNHDEITGAYEYLQGQQLIRAQKLGGGAWFGLELTPAGRDALEGQHRLVTPQTATTTHDHSDRSQTFNQQGANIGALSVGDANTVSGRVTVAAQSLEQVRQALTEALDQVGRLPVEHQGPVQEALEDAASVASTESPRPGALRRLVQAASDAAGSAVGTAAGQTIVNLMNSAATLI